ncbi:MAG: hypothetical protein INQ03_02375 [Candidatus Heimdallarchaeota archaeon]|nr:hypothetical protein [Candidatus Heimdallarchaeota archaeon]
MKFNIKTIRVSDLVIEVQAIGSLSGPKLLMIHYNQDRREIQYVFQIKNEIIILEIELLVLSVPSIEPIFPQAYIYELELVLQYKFYIENFYLNPIHHFKNAEFPYLDIVLRYVDGKLTELTVGLGLQYRQLEKMMEGKFLSQVVDIQKTVFSSCSLAHQICILSVLDPDRKNIVGYETLLNLQKANNHLLWIILFLLELGMEKELCVQLNTLRSQLYTKIISKLDLVAFVSGEGLHIPFATLHEILDSLHSLLIKMKNIQLESMTITSGKYASVGPLGRSIGVIHDFTLHKLNSDPGLDGYFKQRIHDLENCVLYLRKRSILEFSFTPQLLKDTMYINHVDAPNGTLVYKFELDEKGALRNIRIAIPGLINLRQILEMIEHAPIHWVSLLLRLFDMGVDPIDRIKIFWDDMLAFEGSNFREFCVEVQKQKYTLHEIHKSIQKLILEKI